MLIEYGSPCMFGEGSSFKSNTVYIFKKKIGEGGSAEVFLYKRRIEGCPEQEIVLKVLKNEDEALIQELINDGETLNRLQHPNILRTFGFERVDNKKVALLLEYVAGSTLKNTLSAMEEEQRPLYALQIAASLLDALGAAHKAGVIHGDVSARNILVSQTGEVKLADFGIATVMSKNERTTQLKGNPEYLSPERWAGQRPNEISDLFSLGMVVFEVLTGANPIGRFRTNDIPKRLEEFLESKPWQSLRSHKWVDFFEFVFCRRGESVQEARHLLPRLSIELQDAKKLLAATVSRVDHHNCFSPTQTFTIFLKKMEKSVQNKCIQGLVFLWSVFLAFIPQATGIDGKIGVRRLRPCLLTVTSQPWGEVFLNGKSYGYTPLVNVEIPSGYQEMVWRDYRGRKWKKSIMAFDNGIFAIQIKK